MSLSRVERVKRLVEREIPYRVNERQIRRVLAIVPIPRPRLRPTMERFVAAVVALPSRISP